MSKSGCVLVTGGAGIIGSHVVDLLISEGYGVRVLDDLSSGKLANIQPYLDSGAVRFLLIGFFLLSTAITLYAITRLKKNSNFYSSLL